MVDLSDILGAKILIVDDLEANVRCSIACCARPAHLRRVYDGSTRGLRLHRDNRYDLILLDLECPAWTDSR